MSSTKTFSLARAAFAFGVSEQDADISRDRPLTAEPGRIIERLKNDLAEPATLTSLERILREESGAKKAEIEVESCTFRFYFTPKEGVEEAYGGPPWAIVAPSQPQSEPNLREKAEGLFRREGFVRLSDEEAPEAEAQFKRVQHATGLVWNQYICRALDRAVSNNKVKLFARVQKPTADLQPVPKDLWPILTVIDWENGIGVDPEGICYYAIHFASSAPVNTTIRDERFAIKALAEQIHKAPHLTRKEALAFLTEARVQAH